MTAAPSPAPGQGSGKGEVDFDLDLDLDLGGDLAPAPGGGLDLDLDLGQAAAPAAAADTSPSRSDDRSLDFDLNLEPSGATPPAFATSGMGELRELDLPAPAPAPASPTPSRPQPLDEPRFEPSTRAVPLDLVPSSPPLRQPLEFKLDDISLDLDETPLADRVVPTVMNEDLVFDLPDQPSEFMAQSDDPLIRKIDLADEFRQIGDDEGARELLREVLSQAEGEVKARAQKLLDDLA